MTWYFNIIQKKGLKHKDRLLVNLHQLTPTAPLATSLCTSTGKHGQDTSTEAHLWMERPTKIRCDQSNKIQIIDIYWYKMNWLSEIILTHGALSNTDKLCIANAPRRNFPKFEIRSNERRASFVYLKMFTAFHNIPLNIGLTPERQQER